MSTPLLYGFATAIVARLAHEKLVELEPAGEARAATFVANWLGKKAQGTSLLSSLERALLTCPEVHELYADRDALKAIIEDLKHG
jgi:hypothetical protein